MSFIYEVPESTLGVEQDGSCVVLTMRLLGIQGFRFALSAGSEWAAKLLARAIRDQLQGAMERARRDAYEAGWRDRTAKRPKRAHFFGRLP